MPAKRLPNMLIIGAKKASSTLLYELLCQHPQVWMPQEKEPHCLVTASDPDKIREQYARLFEPAPDSALILGEASTGYTTMPYNGPIPRRIQQALGQPKLIYILRDPVERLISNYRQLSSRLVQTEHDARRSPGGRPHPDRHQLLRLPDSIVRTRVRRSGHAHPACGKPARQPRRADAACRALS